MKKIIVLSLFMGVAMHADVTEKQVIQVQLGFGANEVNTAVDEAPLSAGKTLKAVGLGAATGGALFFGTALSKNYDAFNNPFVYVFLASVLLYNQRDIVKSYLGSAYTGVVAWASMISLVATGAMSEIMLKAKKITESVKMGRSEDENCAAQLPAA